MKDDGIAKGKPEKVLSFEAVAPGAMEAVLSAIDGTAAQQIAKDYLAELRLINMSEGLAASLVSELQKISVVTPEAGECDSQCLAVGEFRIRLGLEPDFITIGVSQREASLDSMEVFHIGAIKLHLVEDSTGRIILPNSFPDSLLYAFLKPATQYKFTVPADSGSVAG